MYTCGYIHGNHMRFSIYFSQILCTTEVAYNFPPFPVLYWCTLFPMPLQCPLTEHKPSLWFGIALLMAKHPVKSLLSDLNTPCGLWHLRMCVLAVKEHEVTMCWDKQSWAADGAMTQAINPLLHARTERLADTGMKEHLPSDSQQRNQRHFTNPSWTPERSEKPWFYFFIVLYPEKKIRSSFTHPHAVPKPAWLSSVEHKKEKTLRKATFF